MIQKRNTVRIHIGLPENKTSVRTAGEEQEPLLASQLTSIDRSFDSR